jgi:hypothetical protein
VYRLHLQSLRIAEQDTSVNAYDKHDVISQKLVLSISTAVRTSDPAVSKLFTTETKLQTNTLSLSPGEINIYYTYMILHQNRLLFCLTNSNLVSAGLGCA